MEGVFAFFLESSFLGLFLFGEKRFGQKVHWLAGFMVFAGSWISGFFIIVTDAWMQHPVGYEIATNGTAHLSSFWSLLFNEWAFWQYLHNMVELSSQAHSRWQRPALIMCSLKSNKNMAVSFLELE
jgi:cytochrome d ubiquinol oxidase subunit I